jgi:tetratricopeptide (TPR) repeat protein
MGDRGESVLDIVGRRWSVLESLLDGPTYKRDLVASVDRSRSTVDRSVRELADAGLVERTSDGYVASAAGRLAAEEYRSTTASLAAVEGAAAALAPLPHDAPLSAPMLTDADVTVVDRDGTTDAVTDRFLDHVAAEGRTVLGTAAPESFVADVADIAGRTVLVPSTAAETAGCRVATEPPPFSLVRTDDTVAVLVHDRGDAHALVECETEAAFEWADDRLDDHDPERTAGPSAAVLPGLLVAGFRRLDDGDFDPQHARDPVTALRAGQGFADIAAGHALPRERPAADGERERLDEVVFGRLAAGNDVALVAPPGSGKSTVCRQVAHRWVREDRGPVWYRPGGSERPLEATDDLIRMLDDVAGHALVVVEDAVRAGAAVFETMRAFRDDPTVSVLVDARVAEWGDPPGEPLAPAARSYRDESVELVRMPPLDERERERFVAHVAATLDRSPDELAAAGAVSTDAESTTAPSAVLAFLHCLATVAGVGERVPSALEADAEVTLEWLRERDAPTYDLGVLVNLLNAADLPVEPAYCYALVVPPTDHDPAAVDRAVEALHGRVLFGESPLAGQIPHEEWSVAFLDAMVAAEPAPAAQRRVGRVLSALLSLADDPTSREAVRDALGADAPVLQTVAGDPTGWADGTVDRLFTLVQRRPGLVDLFGESGCSAIDPPAACSPAATVRCTEHRCQARFDRGDYETLIRETRALYRRAAALADPDRMRFQAAAFRHSAWGAIRTSDYDAADRYAEWALALAEQVDDENEAHQALSARGVSAWLAGDLDAAERHLRAAEARADPKGDPVGAASVQNNLGIVHYERGEFDAALERFERSRELRERAGVRLPLVDSLINLGVIERDRGRSAAATERFESAVDLARGAGAQDFLAHALRALGNTLADLGRADGATERLEEALDLAREAGNRENVAHCLRGLGVAARARGDLETAESHLSESREVAAAVGADRALALALRELGGLTREQGDPETALAQLDESLATFDAGTRNAETARTHRERGEALLALGDRRAARGAFRSARDQYRALGADSLAVECESRADTAAD